MATTIADSLVARLAEIGPCVVAYSGGVDSSLVAAAAYRALGDQCVAVTGLSPAVSSFDRAYAERIAKQIGIRHLFVETQEQHDPNYVRNDAKRCYYCKSELFRQLRTFAQRLNFDAIVSGTNADDLGDYRPGLQAGEESNVQTPLADLKLRKSDVRAIARQWNLDVAERPAAPCLASRIAYGISAEPQTLQMIERAEAILRELGFEEQRVRLHENKLARIEVSANDLDRFMKTVDFAELTRQLKSLGFQFVTVDLQGLQSGSMNLALRTKQLPVLQ